jgi:hypothetical protein
VYLCAVGTRHVALDPSQVAPGVNVKKIWPWRIADRYRRVVLPAESGRAPCFSDIAVPTKAENRVCVCPRFDVITINKKGKL